MQCIYIVSLIYTPNRSHKRRLRFKVRHAAWHIALLDWKLVLRRHTKPNKKNEREIISFFFANNANHCMDHADFEMWCRFENEFVSCTHYMCSMSRIMVQLCVYVRLKISDYGAKNARHVIIREISSCCFTLFISVSNVSIQNNIMFIRLFASSERDTFWTGSVYTRDNRFSYFFSLQFTARYDPW